jgi:aminopeptidase N
MTPSNDGIFACVPGSLSRVTLRPQLQWLIALLPVVAPSRAVGQVPRDSSATAILTAGISQTLARHRAATISDVRYDLTLDVSPLDSAIGCITIRFRKSDSADAIIDFRGRSLTRALANGRPIPAGAAENGHLRIPAQLLRVGENQLDFAFVADIAPSGASIIRSHDPTDGSDYLYTLLVPADANQLFPSFDQPDLKARVRLTLVTPVFSGARSGSQGRGPQGQRLLRGAAERDRRNPGPSAQASLNRADVAPVSDARSERALSEPPPLRSRAPTKVESAQAWSVVANGAIESADTNGGRLTTRFAETRVCTSGGRAGGSQEPKRWGESPGRGLQGDALETAGLEARVDRTAGASRERVRARVGNRGDVGPELGRRVRMAPGSGGRALQRPAGALAVLTRAPEHERPSQAAATTERSTCAPAPISTYLIAFAAGPWHHLSSTNHGRTITAYVRASRAAEADLDSLLSLNQRALDWMERYFGRPYPFEKFAFVLAPAFPFGGMEHPGAVFYNEDRFIFRERPTLPQRLNRLSTILHEVAHQWFGDLVTMRWFDDLWLKEGFATFMAAKALAEIDPGADAWKTFYLSNKPPAYAVDQTAGTRPLWQELTNLDQAKSNYGAIVYNKAPSVLKQLEYLVGDSAFQLGVQRFLNRHAYANATWQDLLGAIGQAAGRPLEAFGRDFMLRPGMPVVEQQLELHEGKIAQLRLVQRPAKSLSGNQPWTERTEVLLFYSDRPAVRIPVELRSRVTDVAAAKGKQAPEFVFANARDYGYFLLLLDSSSVRTLEDSALGKVKDPFLRAMLWGALWDQVRNYRMAPERFVGIVTRELGRERDEQIVPVALARTDRALRAYMSPEARKGAQHRTRTYGLRKAYVDAFIGLATSPKAIRRLNSLFSSDTIAGEPAKDPTRWDIATRLLELKAPEAESRYAEQVKRDTTADGRRRAFIGAAGRFDSTTKRTYFTRYFGDATLNEDWASGSLGEFNALEHQALTFPYLPLALDSLPYIQAHRRIFFLETWLAAFLRGQTGDSALVVVQHYLKEHPNLPLDLRRKVLQHADELERTVQIRERSAGRSSGQSAAAKKTAKSRLKH